MEEPHLDQEILERVSGLIRLGVGVLNSLIGLRYVLKLLGANPTNPFAELVYGTTQPFLSMFQGLIPTLIHEGMVFEFHDLIAIATYGLLGWIAIQLLQVMLGRIK
jgi:uncharacterized protein YggT (Ycf19 family)